MAICSVPECDREAHARGWCPGHYRQWFTKGIEPSGRLAPRRPHRPRDRSIYDHIILTSTRVGECLEYTSHLDDDGYGTITGYTAAGNRRPIRAHRVVMEHHHGPAPEDAPYVLHSCDNRCCVELAHLRFGDALANAQDRVARRGR